MMSNSFNERLRQRKRSEIERYKRSLDEKADRWCKSRRRRKLPVEYNSLAVYLNAPANSLRWEFFITYAREFTRHWLAQEEVSYAARSPQPR